MNKTYITNEFLQLMKKVDLKTSSRSFFFMMAMSAGLTLLPQELLAVENSIQAVLQGNDVEGVVKDASGEPIIGATVRVVGTKIATVTDFEGNFKNQCQKWTIPADYLRRLQAKDCKGGSWCPCCHS